MLYIERPKGRDIEDERVALTVRDENGLRAATIFVEVGVRPLNIDEIVIRVDRPLGDLSRVVVEV